MPSLKNIITGAAVGTFLGSLSVALYPKRRKLIENVTDKAKEYADGLFAKGKSFSLSKEDDNNGWLSGLSGGIAGMILGAGATLLLTPITGKQMRTQIRKTYNDLNRQSTTKELRNRIGNEIYRNLRPRRTIRRKPRTRSRPA